MSRLEESMTAHGVSAFMRADQFPVGSVCGRTDPVPESPSGCRPFGLMLAEAPRDLAPLDLSAVRYDGAAQIGWTLDRRVGRYVPLSKHTDGQTGTVTYPDGNGGNDKDTDHRED